MREIEVALLKANPGGFRNAYGNFNAIHLGPYSMSIQGSTGHYCTPRSDFHVCGYISMELLLYKKGRKYDIWKCKDVKSFPRVEELLERNTERNYPIGWVDMELLNDLYLHLKTLTRS